ncbi:aspartyl protease family protein [Streptomyces caeni]|uniref:Aspartyl protease family protein n=1 Tax=Streptomyces caeni TaxID=2307231 RepID=A0ABW4INQ6_9ACTN
MPPVWRLVVAVVGLSALSAGCGGWGGEGERQRPTPGSSAVRDVPMKVIQREGQTLALVPVSIQGHGPYVFVLDTGASSSVVDDDVASSLGLPRTGEKQTISGVVGSEKVPFARLADWRVGDVELGASTPAVVDLDRNGKRTGAKGLLGSDVLSRFGHITVDYAGGKLRLPAS